MEKMDGFADADIAEYEHMSDRLGVHIDSFSATRQEVEDYPFSAYAEEEGGDVDHHPFDHTEAFEAVQSALMEWGIQVTDAHHAMSRGGKRYGALMAVFPQKAGPFKRTLFSDYRPVVMMRNSYDKSYPLEVEVGAHFHESDTLLISKKSAGRRRHTNKFEFDVYDVLTEIVRNAVGLMIEQELRIDMYREHEIDTERHMHDIIFRAFEKGVIPVTFMPKAKEAALTPPLSGHSPRTALTMLQAILSTRQGKDIFALSRLAGDLEEMFDREVGFDREIKVEETDIPDITVG
jgi:hypothetical protein